MKEVIKISLEDHGDVYADHYHSLKKNPFTLIAAHGIPGSSNDFKYLGPSLSEKGIDLIALNMPGFSTSKDAYRKSSFQSRGDIILKSADYLGLNRFGVIGHSFGASSAYAAAFMGNERVLLLVAINGVGVRIHKGLKILPQIFYKISSHALKTPFMKDFFQVLVSKAYRKAGFRGTFTHKDLAWHMQLIGDMDFNDHQRALNNFKNHVLFATSQDDPLIEPLIYEETINEVSGILTHLHWPDGGHYLQKYRASEIAHEISRIISGIV